MFKRHLNQGLKNMLTLHIVCKNRSETWQNIAKSVTYLMYTIIFIYRISQRLSCLTFDMPSHNVVCIK